MNKILVILSITLFSFSGYSQKMIGYLGQRVIVGGNFHVMPALGISGDYYVKSFGNELDEYKTLANYEYLWNKRNEFYIGYVISKVTVVKLNYSYFKSGFLNRLYRNYPLDNIDLYYSMKSKSLGVDFEFYFNKDLPATIGLYYQLGVNFVNSKLVDEGGVLYGEDGIFSQQFGMDFKDPGYKVTELYISNGFGKRFLIAKDNLFLNIGAHFSFSPKAFVETSQESWQDDTGTFESKGYEKIDEEAFQGTKHRTRGVMSTDVYVGLNLLF